MEDFKDTRWSPAEITRSHPVRQWSLSGYATRGEADQAAFAPFKASGPVASICRFPGRAYRHSKGCTAKAGVSPQSGMSIWADCTPIECHGAVKEAPPFLPHFGIVVTQAQEKCPKGGFPVPASHTPPQVSHIGVAYVMDPAYSVRKRLDALPNQTVAPMSLSLNQPQGTP